MILVPSDGLYLADDSSDPTSSTLGSLAGIIDGDKTDNPSSYYSGGKSYGLDLGSSQKVVSLILYSSAHNGEQLYSTWDDMVVYKSDDNATWTQVKVFVGATDCTVVEESDHCHFKLQFDSSETARYFKVYSSSGLAFGSGGLSAIISEIEAYKAFTVSDFSHPSLELVVDSSKIDSSLTDFPLAINLAKYDTDLVDEIDGSPKKLAITVNDSQCFIETEVIGKKVLQGPVSSSTAVEAVSASSKYSINYPAAEAFNGSTDNRETDRWVSVNSYSESTGLPDSGDGEWYQFDFIDSIIVESVRLITGNLGERAPRKITFYVSDTGTFSGEETSCGQFDYGEMQPANNAWTDDYVIPNPTAGKYLRMVVNEIWPSNNGYVIVPEWEVTIAQGQLYVKVPSISDTADTRLKVYVDSAQEDNIDYVGEIGSTVAQNVWDANFEAVYHMAQDPSGTAPQLLDSTDNGHNGTSTGSMTANDLIETTLGKGIIFDGSDDSISVGTSTDFDESTGNFTIVLAVKITAYETSNNLWGDLSAGNAGFGISITDSGYVRVFTDGDWRITTTEAVPLGESTVIVVVKDVTGLRIAINNVFSGTTYTGTITNNAASSSIGDDYSVTSANCFSGIIDEVSYSITNRSDAWIKAINYSWKSDLLTPVISPKNAAHSKTITIDSSKIDQTLINFPLALDIGSICDEEIPDILIKDSFSGSDLDTGKWGTYIEPDASVSVDEELQLNNIDTGAHSGAKVYTLEEFDTTGITTLKVKWKPHKDHYSSATLPCLRFVRPDASREIYYGERDNFHVTCFLGVDGDTTDRSGIRLNHYGAGSGGQIGTQLSVTTIDIDETIWHDLVFTLNWDTGEVSFDLDDGTYSDTQTVPQATLTDIGDKFVVELATSDYVKNNTERFKDLIVSGSNYPKKIAIKVQVPDRSSQDQTALFDVGSGKDYATIADAVAAVTTGGIIRIWPGTYDESIQMTKHFHVLGMGNAYDDVVISQSTTDPGNCIGLPSDLNSASWHNNSKVIYIENVKLAHTYDGRRCINFTGATDSDIVVNVNTCHLDASASNVYAVGALDGPTLNLINCRLDRGYAHFVECTSGEINLKKCLFDETPAYYLCNITVTENDYVTVTTDGYGPENGEAKLINDLIYADEIEQCPVEIECWEPTNLNMVVHTKLSLVSYRLNLEVTLFWDEDKADNSSFVGVAGSTPAQDVWDSDFIAVYHMAQDPSGGAGCILDSTSNAINGTPEGTMTLSDLVDADLGKAVELDGSDDSILLVDSSVAPVVLQSLGSDGDAFTIESLSSTVVTTQAGTGWRPYDVLFELRQQKGSGAKIAFSYGIESSKLSIGRAPTYTTGTEREQSNSNLIADVFQYNAISIDDDVAKFYLEGLLDATKTFTTATGDCSVGGVELSNLRIGARTKDDGTPDNFIPGKIAEIRLSSIKRSAAWVKATNYSFTGNLFKTREAVPGPMTWKGAVRPMMSKAHFGYLILGGI